MEFRDAISIAGLGLSVVFGGLSLTALLIVSINGLPEMANRFGRRFRTLEPQPSPATHGKPLDPEVVTVIATVLEVERRLHGAEYGKRLTISRQG